MGGLSPIFGHYGRKWKTRVKGRDWYDLVWYVAQHPQVRLAHLESRMRQSGDYTGDVELTAEILQALLRRAVEGAWMSRRRAGKLPPSSKISALLMHGHGSSSQKLLHALWRYSARLSRSVRKLKRAVASRLAESSDTLAA